MKTTSELMNELAAKSNFLCELSESDSKKLKTVLLEIFIEVARICHKYNLTYMMAGGSALGAVRHKGFIPWDDDLDLIMPRDDYEKFIHLCNTGTLSNDYEIDYPRKGHDCKNPYLKVFKKGTLNVEVFAEDAPFPNGIFIDIFPIENYPKSQFIRTIKSILANGLKMISIAVLYAKYPSKSMKEFAQLDSALNRRYQIQRIIGKILGIIPHRFWIYWYDQFVQTKKRTGIYGIPTGRKYYDGEVFDYDVYFPPSHAEFEGIQVNLPHNYDAYLKNLYKNYMELPPIDKRERHFVIQFKS